MLKCTKQLHIKKMFLLQVSNRCEQPRQIEQAQQQPVQINDDDDEDDTQIIDENSSNIPDYDENEVEEENDDLIVEDDDEDGHPGMLLEPHVTITSEDAGGCIGDELETDSQLALLKQQKPLYILDCPQCGIVFDSYDNNTQWRQHINEAHNLGKRDSLNFTRITAVQHKCNQCGEHVSGRKLRDMQVHKFKHLSSQPYIHCSFCSAGYYHLGNMKDHIRTRHPDMMAQQETHNYEEEDEENFRPIVCNEADNNNAEDHDEDDEIMITNAAATEDEAVEDIEEEDDGDQYLLG